MLINISEKRQQQKQQQIQKTKTLRLPFEVNRPPRMADEKIKWLILAQNMGQRGKRAN